MKKLIIYIVLLLTVTSVYSQGNINLDSIKYINGNEDFLLLDREVKGLFKTSPLAYEHRITTGISISAILFEGTLDATLIDSTSALLDAGLQYGLEGRYYLNMKSRIQKGLQADNLSGEYVFLSAMRGNFLRFGLSNNDSIDISTNTGTRRLIRFGSGIQNRFNNSFYTDSRLEVEFKRSSDNISLSDFSTFTLRTIDRIGLVLGKRKKEKNILYPEIRTYSNKNFSFRVHRNNFLLISRESLPSFTGNDNEWTIQLQPEISSEQKINNSSFSIYQELRARIRFNNTSTPDIEYKPIIYSFEIGTRYYYKMKKRIRDGQGGNNFSGQFFLLSYEHFNTSDIEDVTRNFGGIHYGWGYQQEINDKFYMGFTIAGQAIVFREGDDDINSLRAGSFKKEFLDLTIGMILK
jgi:hypothetical protein